MSQEFEDWFDGTDYSVVRKSANNEAIVAATIESSTLCGQRN